MLLTAIQCQERYKQIKPPPWRKIVGHNGWIFSLWLLLCCFMSLAQAASALTDTHAVDAHTSAAKPNQTKKFFSVAVGQDSYPYQFIGDDGSADGLMIDIWRLWAKKNNYDIEFKPYRWSKTLQQVESQEVDFHAGMAITPERQRIYRMGEPIVAFQASLFVHKQLTGIYSLADIQPYVVGVIEGSSHVTTLRRLMPGLNLKMYPSRDALYSAAINGNLKVFAGQSRISTRHSHFDRLSKMFPLYKKMSYQSFPFAFATHIDSVALAEEIERGLLLINDQEIQTLERKWLGIGNDDNLLVIAMPADMPPYMSVSAQGEPIGLFVDLWKKWAEKTKREIVFLSDNAEISMQNLGSKKADIHAAYADDSVNANLYPHAHHIYSYDSKVYYPLHKDAKPITEKNIGQSKVGILRADPVKKEFSRRFPNAEVVNFSDISSMIDAAQNRHIDAFIAGKEIVKVHFIQSNQQAKFASLDKIQFESKLYSLVRQDNKALVSQIKEGFSLFSIDELRNIENAWIQSPDSQFFSGFKTKVNLTAAQKSWLLRHPVIRLGALNNWAPIEFADDKGQFSGVTADLMELVEKRAQITIDVHMFSEWSLMLEALKNGSIDMVASMEKTEQRLSFASFTDGYWPQHWALILPNDAREISKVADLKGKRLAVVKGYHLISYIHQIFPQILLQIVPDSRMGFEAVRQGKADAFIDGMVAAANELKDGDYRDLRFTLVDDIEPAIERIGVRKDWPPLIDILNKVISTITEQEKKAILESWFEIKIESGINRKKVLQVGILVVVIFAFILIWNRRLKSEIHLRRAMEHKMKHMATHDELTGLPNRVLLRDRLNTAIANHARHHEMLALLFIDLDGFKDINDTYGHDVGDELLIQLGERFRHTIRKSDSVSRFGGDEFVVLLTSLHHTEEAAQISEKLLSMIKQPFCLSRCTVWVGASIGIAMYPDDGTTDTDLMKVADTLMYKVKASGKNNYLFNQAEDVYPTL